MKKDTDVRFKNEIDELLRYCFFDPESMSEEEYQEQINEALNKYGKSIERLSNDISIGIANGYPVEVQIEITKALFKKDKS